MLVLGIESTCDETACAVVRDGSIILSNIISSQIDLHQEYGGVVPELACRRHIDVIIPVLDEALKQANVQLSEIDLISAAYGPGLIGALLIGLNTAKALSLALNKPFIGINHIEAHLYAAIMSTPDQVSFPCIGAVLSGGHTTLVLIKEVGVYELISQTVDDAIGEAFDKVAKMLDLPYPGGPKIEALAKKGDTHRFPFKSGQVKGKPLDFSFSGLKTAVLYALKGQNLEQAVDATISDELKQDISASFQYAAFSDIIKKTLSAASIHGCNTIIFGGGVTNSQYLRNLFTQTNNAFTYIWPSMELTLDNAAMIAGLAYHQFNQKGLGDSIDLEPLTRIAFT